MSKGKEMTRLACKALDAKKAIDIKVIDIQGISVMADYFIISTAGNPNQVQAMVDNVEETMEKAGYMVKHVEGSRGSNWILMDFGDVIVHIFDEENRLFYDLERIWRDGVLVDAKEFMKEDQQ
ncbi:MAG: ribosome silencing factor [Lachnospiraceae bacterium]|nr:ribosome silencing factor [Lachnospiraceae bacterium]MCI9098293.1 ribosome silencing factor [Lachnospiraceae bacterium]MCI9356711.1 ribosome silencing factor [Lachnospiraceae bacterium]